jgi:hypothetical protein
LGGLKSAIAGVTFADFSDRHFLKMPIGTFADFPKSVFVENTDRAFFQKCRSRENRQMCRFARSEALKKKTEKKNVVL